MNITIPAWVDGELKPVEKLEVHRKGLRHKAVSVFVMRGTEVLMQQRALTKYHTPGLWTNTCCTHPYWDEAPSVCAVRRLEQELGIEGLSPVHRQQLEYIADVGEDMVEHELVDVFLAQAPRDLKVVPNPHEVMDTDWIDYHDLKTQVARNPDLFTPWLRIYLADHSDSIFGPDLNFTARA